MDFIDLRSQYQALRGNIDAHIARVLEQPAVVELIIVNDCSSDRTQDVLETLAKNNPRIRLFAHQVDVPNRVSG